ncbi:5'-methylthioadenosine/S-adenosylhomocysteine nucleosidase [Sphingomonas prati]|uniref:Adenosylhomocysteine nucleosidase n=1 Tax=Sphingomonas prati TaxID=1843237 RepID=A0A7W9F228_9SPHN|nr:5'-methylthioadenosine/S-adenosylhomocysteine nucleosidase [Sphingomonas prati]MBB5728060.1 adenosylhomocysteine nucleosidase [Sphingomonas prati]GGE82942.1 5'-methylthioadenosine/S-adenosylhomocysteine nucleosidase [Sphingomonas prati]
MMVDEIAGRRVLFAMAVGQEYGPELRRRIAPLLTGVGPVEAALSTAAALQRLESEGRRPDLVVSLGSAGSRRCPLGTVWQVSGVSWRDMDATRLGFARGVTPFADHPAVVPLPTPLPGVPTATLSTGADIVWGDGFDAVDADMVDMETFAVVRACARFGVPVVGLRGVSDGPGELDGLSGWTALLGHLDRELAVAVDGLAGVVDLV